tara:strand:+ start:157 stop:339 length:183 start_codon:yes stop_codon:yes gene_type:complete
MYNNNTSLLGLPDPEKDKEEHAKRILNSVERKKTTSEKKYNEFVKSIKYKKSKSKKNKNN